MVPLPLVEVPGEAVPGVVVVGAPGLDVVGAPGEVLVGAPGVVLVGAPGALAGPLGGVLLGAAGEPLPTTPVAGGVVDAPGPVPGAQGAAAPIVPVTVAAPDAGVVLFAVVPLVPVARFWFGLLAVDPATAPLAGGAFGAVCPVAVPGVVPAAGGAAATPGVEVVAGAPGTLGWLATGGVPGTPVPPATGTQGTPAGALT